MTTRFRKSNGLGYLLALLIYISVMVIVSYVSVARSVVVAILPWDKLLHFLQYLPVGFLTAMWHFRNREIRSRVRTRTWVLGIVVLLATLDEGIQCFVSFRDGSVLDILSDILGGVVGGEAAWHMNRYREMTRFR